MFEGLSNGKWRQVVIDSSLEHSVKVMVDSEDHVKFISPNRLDLNTYSMYPFSSDGKYLSITSLCLYH